MYAYGRISAVNFSLFYESELDASNGPRNMNLKIGPPITGKGEPEKNPFLPGQWSQLGLRKRSWGFQVIGVKSLEAPIAERPIF